MKTTIGIIAAAVMSFTVVGCGADQTIDKAKPVTQTIHPDQAARPPAGQVDRGKQGAGPRCRDPEVCLH